MSIAYLSVEDLLALIDDLSVGPVRDLGLLESAAHRPTVCVWGHEAYPSLDLKAAALLESIVRYHPLVDGNKRLGWLAAFVFDRINGVMLDAPDDEAYALVISAAGGKAGIEQIAVALEGWQQPETDHA